MSFGDCCGEMAEMLSADFNRHFYVGENDVLFLAVGHVVTEDGPGWFDQAVLFCPFCGTAVQTREDIAKKAQH